MTDCRTTAAPPSPAVPASTAGPIRTETSSAPSRAVPLPVAPVERSVTAEPVPTISRTAGPFPHARRVWAIAVHEPRALFTPFPLRPGNAMNLRPLSCSVIIAASATACLPTYPKGESLVSTASGWTCSEEPGGRRRDGTRRMASGVRGPISAQFTGTRTACGRS
jgi:hypothetical protein